MFGRKIHLNETIVGYISRSQYCKNRNLINHHVLKRCQICSKTLIDIIFLLYRASYDQYSPSRYHVSVLHLQYEIKCMCIFFEVIEWFESKTCYSRMLFVICKKVSIFLWREMVEQRKIMLSLYINKETDIFYLRNLTPLYEKKDFQYTGKIIKTGTFNLSKHYSITSEKNSTSF